MARFQLIGCEIHIGGDRDNTVVKDKFDPVTLPEFVILRTIHGGIDHVHSAVCVGYRELNPETERERLALKYGEALVSGLFPGAMANLPTEDASLPTTEEIEAGAKAAKAARKVVREKAPDKDPPAKTIKGPGNEQLPDLTK